MKSVVLTLINAGLFPTFDTEKPIRQVLLSIVFFFGFTSENYLRGVENSEATCVKTLQLERKGKINHEKQSPIINMVSLFHTLTLFSSPELKAQVSFSDQNLSVVRRRCRRCRCRRFHIFMFFSRTTGPISTKFGTKHPWVKGFKFVQMKGPALCQGEIITQIAKIH